MNFQKSRHAWRVSLALGLCGALAACGGGASDAAMEVPAALPTPLANSTPVPTPAAINAAVDASCGMNGPGGIQAEVLRQINALRAVGAVCGTTIYAAAAPLNWNNLLQQAAIEHSSDMAQHNYFSHDSLEGKTVAQRLADVGYGYSAAAENIAANSPDVASVVTQWLNSPRHCTNMMNPAYRDIGVACVRSDTATYGSYWTMDLGRS